MSEQKPPSQLPPGYELGKFTIQRLVGRGRMTEVYRAYHPDFQRDVAIKLRHSIMPKTPETLECFRQEAQAIANLKHPNITRMYDFGGDKDAYYLVMELIVGTSLRDMISARPTGIDHDDMLRIFSQISSAVAYAHDQRVVHGNIKPDNVLLDAGKRPVLTDFTVPCLAEEARSDPNQARHLNPAYLSPEQAMGNAATPACDIYAMGILLYEMVTGNVPFRGNTYDSVVSQHQQAAPTPPSEIHIGLDPRIEHTILKALNKNPADRYVSAREMLSDLEREETSSQYATLAFDREVAKEVRKRTSEIVRFERTRTDRPAPVEEPVATPSTSASSLPLLIVGLVLVVILIITLVVLTV